MVAKTIYEKLGRTAAVAACALIVAVAVFAFLGLALAANTNATDVLADYATDIPLSEEAQLALDDDSAAEDVLEVGQNDDEPLADGVTAPEASEERPDEQPSASVSEGDQGAGSADEGRAYSLRLLVKASAENIRAEDAVLGEHEGVHLLGFADEAALAAAEEYYASAAEWCERDIPMGVSEGEAPEGDPAPVSAEDNALALLEDAGAEPVGTPAGKLLVALVDTGAPADAAVVNAASVIGDDTADHNGHASAMLAAMKQQDPDVRLLAVKALDDTGVGSASSVYAAIEYAVSAGADVINLSLAGRASYGNAAIADAVNDALAAGIVVVAAAGNGGYDASAFTPANVPGVITVGACDEEGNVLESSNRGSAVDFFVVADSTSAAAARVSGWLSANGASEGWQDLLADEAWISTGIDAEGGDPGDEVSDDISASYAKYNILRGYHIDVLSGKTIYTAWGSNNTLAYVDKTQKSPAGRIYTNTTAGTLFTSKNLVNGSNMSSTRKYTCLGGYALTRNYTGNEMSGGKHTAASTNGVWTNFDMTYKVFDVSGYSATANQSVAEQAFANAYDQSGNKSGYAEANNVNYYEVAFLWQPTIYTITLNDNSGSGGSGSVYEAYYSGIYKDSSYTQEITTTSNAVTVPTRPGYVFQGYYKDSTTNTTKYIDSNGYLTSSFDTHEFSSNTSIYARWVRVELNDNGGSGGQGAIYPLYNDGVYRDQSLTQLMGTSSNPVPVPTRPGYIFQGYYTATSGGTRRIDANGYIKSTSKTTFGQANGTTTLYAQWKVAPWRITLDKQGGTGGQNEIWEMNSVGIFHDQAMTTKVNGTYPVSLPSKPYQTFMGYYKQQYATGGQCITASGTINTNYFGNNTFTYDATIYAGWDGLQITVNKQSGSGGTNTFYSFYNEGWGTNRYGSTPITKMTPPTRSNYTFMGYFTGTGGSGTQITDASGNFLISNTYFKSATTIYAYWAPENYLVTLDPQGADITVGTPQLWTVYNQGIYTDMQFTNAVSNTIPITVPQRTGYVFQGYYNYPQTSNSATRGTQYIKADGTLTGNLTKTNRQNRTLYAQWFVAPHNVFLDHQGGSGGQSQVYEMIKSGVAHDYAMSVKVGYTGSSSRKNPVAVPTKPFQTFNGYYSQQYGRGTQLITNAGWRTAAFDGDFFSSDATIYAYWKGFKLALDRQSGTGGPTQIFSFYNEKYTSDERGSLPIPSITPPHRSSYTFMGYFTQKNGAGTQIIDGTGAIVAPDTFFTSTATLYAYWLPENYTITLDPTGADAGALGTPAVYELYGISVCLDNAFTIPMSATTNPITVPVKTGKVFRGYYTNRNSTYGGSGSKAIDENGYLTSFFNTKRFTSDTTLYARWTSAPYTISLDNDGGSGGSGAVYELYGTGVFLDFACTSAKWMTGSSNPVAIPTPPTATPFRVFGGYWTQQGGLGSRLIDENGYRRGFSNTLFNTDNTIYAFWRGYTITLNDQGGRNGSGAVYEYYGEDIFSDLRGTTPTTSANVPIRNNYDFRGYYTGTGGSGTQLIDENGAFTSAFTNTYFSGDATIYAYWTPKMYTITLNNQNADPGLEGSDAVYESYGAGVYLESNLASVMTTTLNPITVPQRQYSKFGGYFTQTGGRGTKRIDENGYKTNYFTATTYASDDVLYAYWQPLTITLDDQGGSGGSGAIYEDYGIAFYKNINLTNQMTANSNRVNIPSRSFHVFKGYYTQPNGAGVCVIDATGYIVSPPDPTMFTNDATIYAYWEYHVKLPITGGEGTNTTVLWLAALGVVLGGACVLGRRYLAEAAAANRPGKHAKQPIGRHAKR